MAEVEDAINVAWSCCSLISQSLFAKSVRSFIWKQIQDGGHCRYSAHNNFNTTYIYLFILNSFPEGFWPIDRVYFLVEKLPYRLWSGLIR